MSKSNEKFFNYLLTIGFILILVIFSVSLIGISRMVLSDESNFQQHVITTTTLLQDIEEVEKTTRNQENQTQVLIEEELIKEKLEQNSFNITDYSFTNLEDKTVLVLYLDSKIFQIDKYIIVEITSVDNLSVNDKIIYFSDEVGSVVDIEKDYIRIYSFERKIIEEVPKNEIRGLILFENEEN